jgi:hypothetical protein
MKKIILSAAGALVIAGLAASWQPAEASCVGARLVSSINPLGRSDFVTPGAPHTPYPGGGGLTYYARGWFWALGTGNQGGLGNDSGSNSGEQNYYGQPLGSYNWLKVGPNDQTYESGFFGGSNHWQYPGVDGCIDLTGSDPDLPDVRQCNLVLVDDDDWDGNGYFVLIAQGNDDAGDYFTNRATGNTTVTLAPIPAPRITGSSAPNDQTRNLTVVVDCPVGPAGGLYLNCDADQNNSIATGLRYQLYSVNGLINGSAAPDGDRSRDLPGGFLAPATGPDNPSGWTPVPSGSAVCGQPVNVSVSCTGQESVYLCSQLIVDPASAGGFPTTNCSANAVRVACGPNLAEPSDPIVRPSKEPTLERREPGRDRRSSGR